MTRFKVFVGVCAALGLSLGLGIARTAVAQDTYTVLCCSDQWQGGNLCPPGDVLASYCTDSSCTECGTFFCYTQPSDPRQPQCYQ